MNVYVPKTTQRPQTMPNAKKNLREIGRLRSHCMAETLSLMSRSLHRQRTAGLEGLATALDRSCPFRNEPVFLGPIPFPECEKTTKVRFPMTILRSMVDRKRVVSGKSVEI